MILGSFNPSDGGKRLASVFKVVSRLTRHVIRVQERREGDDALHAKYEQTAGEALTELPGQKPASAWQLLMQ